MNNVCIACLYGVFVYCLYAGGKVKVEGSTVIRYDLVVGGVVVFLLRRQYISANLFIGQVARIPPQLSDFYHTVIEVAMDGEDLRGVSC